MDLPGIEPGTSMLTIVPGRPCSAHHQVSTGLVSAIQSGQAALGLGCHGEPEALAFFHVAGEDSARGDGGQDQKSVDSIDPAAARTASWRAAWCLTAMALGVYCGLLASSGPYSGVGIFDTFHATFFMWTYVLILALPIIMATFGVVMWSLRRLLPPAAINEAYFSFLVFGTMCLPILVGGGFRGPMHPGAPEVHFLALAGIVALLGWLTDRWATKATARWLWIVIGVAVPFAGAFLVAAGHTQVA